MGQVGPWVGHYNQSDTESPWQTPKGCFVVVVGGGVVKVCKDAISLPDGANAANRARIHVAHLISFAPPPPSQTWEICCYAACPQRGSPNLAGLNPSLSDLSNNLSLEEEGAELEETF